MEEVLQQAIAYSPALVVLVVLAIVGLRFMHKAHTQFSCDLNKANERNEKAQALFTESLDRTRTEFAEALAIRDEGNAEGARQCHEISGRTLSALEGHSKTSATLSANVAELSRRLNP